MYHTLARNCSYVGEGYMNGKLYEVAGYPGAVESTELNDKVVGEVYKIVNHNVLPVLDEYEECTDSFPKPHEYVRRKIPVYLLNGEKLFAWVYLYNLEISKLKLIQSGDYLDYVKLS